MGYLLVLGCEPVEVVQTEGQEFGVQFVDGEVVVVVEVEVDAGDFAAEELLAVGVGAEVEVGVVVEGAGQ